MGHKWDVRSPMVNGRQLSRTWLDTLQIAVRKSSITKRTATQSNYDGLGSGRLKLEAQVHFRIFLERVRASTRSSFARAQTEYARGLARLFVGRLDGLGA